MNVNNNENVKETINMEIKITLLGISGTNNSLLTNISNSEYRKQLKIDDQTILVDFLDTAGQEEFSAMRDQWIRDADGCLIGYSVNNLSSFEEVPIFVEQILRVKEIKASHLFPIVLVGNRSERSFDLNSPPRFIQTSEGKVLAKLIGCPFYETDSKESLTHCINELARIILQQKNNNLPLNLLFCPNYLICGSENSGKTTFLRKIVDYCTVGSQFSKSTYYKKGTLYFSNGKTPLEDKCVAGSLSILPRNIILKVITLVNEKDQQNVKLSCKYLHFLVNSVRPTVKQTKTFYSVEFNQATLIDTPGFPPFRNKLSICTISTCTNVSAVLFFVDLSSFDLTTKDTWGVSFVNSMEETFNFFVQLLQIIPVNSRIILYFTKVDLLKKKIERGANILVCPIFSTLKKIPFGFEETLIVIVNKFEGAISLNRNFQSVVVDLEVNDEEHFLTITKCAKLELKTLKLGDPSSFYNGWNSFAKYLSASHEKLEIGTFLPKQLSLNDGYILLGLFLNPDLQNNLSEKDFETIKNKVCNLPYESWHDFQMTLQQKITETNQSKKKIFTPGILKTKISSFELKFKPDMQPFGLYEEQIIVANLSNSTIKCVLSIDEKSKESNKKSLSLRIKPSVLTIKKNQEDVFVVQVVFLKPFSSVTSFFSLRIEDPKKRKTTINYWIKMKINSSRNTPVLQIPYELISSTEKKQTNNEISLNKEKDKAIRKEVIVLNQTSVTIKKIGKIVNEKKYKKQLKSFEKEWKLISRLCHPNLMNSTGFSFDPEKENFVMLMNYYPFGNLKEISKKIDQNGSIPFDLFIKFATDIAKALDYLHFLGLLHQNLSCENILVANLDLVNVESTVLKLTQFCIDEPKKNISKKMKLPINNPTEEKKKVTLKPKTTPPTSFVKKHKRSLSSNGSPKTTFSEKEKQINLTSLSHTTSPNNSSENDSSSANNSPRKNFLKLHTLSFSSSSSKPITLSSLNSNKWIKYSNSTNISPKKTGEHFPVERRITQSSSLDKRDSCFDDLRENANPLLLPKEEFGNTTDSLDGEDYFYSSGTSENDDFYEKRIKGDLVVDYKDYNDSGSEKGDWNEMSIHSRLVDDQCRYCKERKKEMREHLIFCPSFPLRCIYCLYKFPRSVIEIHMQKCLKLTTPYSSNYSVNSKFFSKKEEKISFKKKYDKDNWFVTCPPEVLDGAEFTSKSDVYLYSLTLWQILLPRETLYENHLLETPQLIRYIKKGLARPEMPSKVKPSIRFLIQSCWNKEPSSRPNFSTIVDYLQNLDKLTVKKLDNLLMSSPEQYLGSLGWLDDFESDPLVESLQKHLSDFKNPLSKSVNFYKNNKKDELLFSSSKLPSIDKKIMIGLARSKMKNSSKNEDLFFVDIDK